MVIKQYYKNNGYTIYKCDRCNKIIDTKVNERIRITASITKNSKYKNLKSWDFCENCYRSLVRGIAKGVVKKE